MIQELETKQTELGELPVDWEIVKIDDIFEVKQGKQLSVRESTENKIKKPFLRTSNIFWDKIDITKVDSMYFTKDEFTRLKLEKGDILICEGGDIGRTALFNDEIKECAYQNHLHRLRPKEDNVKRDFFVFWMNYAINLQKMYIHDANRTTIPNLSSSRLKNFVFPLPPLPEQKKIAYVLSKIQDDKEKTENIINSYKELKKSLMKHLFKYGPVKFEDADKVKLKETEIGEMPENWGVNEIKDLIDKTKQKDMRKENTEFKYIDVSSIDRDFYRITGFTLHKGKTSPSRARKIVKANDVIVATVRPTLKRISLVSEDYDNQICSTAFCVLRANTEQLNSKFLYYSTQRSLFFDALSSIQRGASYPAVTDSDIKKQKIAYPNPACQEEIAEILSSVDLKIEQEQNKKKALEELFKSMLHNLMTAKIRVKDIKIGRNSIIAKCRD